MGKSKAPVCSVKGCDNEAEIEWRVRFLHTGEVRTDHMCPEHRQVAIRHVKIKKLALKDLP